MGSEVGEMSWPIKALRTVILLRNNHNKNQ